MNYISYNILFYDGDVCGMASYIGIKGTLDIIRLDKGTNALKAYFTELSKKNYKEAIGILNEENLHFSSLYILKSEIKALKLSDYMNLRNKIAIGVMDEILEDNKSMQSMECSSSEYIQMVCSALKWIVVTGFIDDGFEDDYDRVLDVSSVLLVKVYGDRTILPILADAIFERNRKGYLYNDLVWAFFESRYPYGLILIASRLLSKQSEDVRLAQKLLSFIPGIDVKRTTANERQYLTALHWLEKNNPFLYFTGESFQQSVSPRPYIIVPEAKYLCKTVSVNTGKTIIPLSENEHRLLKEYSELDKDTKIMLSNYSVMLHNINIFHWNTWINRPTTEQVKIAGLWMGGAE